MLGFSLACFQRLNARVSSCKHSNHLWQFGYLSTNYDLIFLDVTYYPEEQSVAANLSLYFITGPEHGNYQNQSL
jgi:hypothetical protein